MRKKRRKTNGANSKKSQERRKRKNAHAGDPRERNAEAASFIERCFDPRFLPSGENASPELEKILRQYNLPYGINETAATAAKKEQFYRVEYLCRSFDPNTGQTVLQDTLHDFANGEIVYDERYGGGLWQYLPARHPHICASLQEATQVFDDTVYLKNTGEPVLADLIGCWVIGFNDSPLESIEKEWTAEEGRSYDDLKGFRQLVFLNQLAEEGKFFA